MTDAPSPAVRHHRGEANDVLTKAVGAVAADPAAGSGAADGTGQTIGLLEFDNFQMSDVSDYLNLVQPAVRTAPITNLSVVPVNGGTPPGPDQDEVLLDIDTVMVSAPGAKVAVYDAPFTGTSGYEDLFNAMINDTVNNVTVISNSWSSCEDQVSLADAQAIDSILETAEAGGISVFNGSGDQGSTCLDGSANTVGVPSDSPHATAVGGTTVTPALTGYGSETWWNGSDATPPTGQGGYGVSQFFPRPAYQNGLNANSMRSVPDVVVNADPATGIMICDASAGGCPAPGSYGGTSFAAPQWAAFAALLNESLGSNIGNFNGAIYPLANTNAFHNADSMLSDFAHVGLGSPNLNLVSAMLAGHTPGIPIRPNPN